MVSYVKYPDWIALVYAQLRHFIVEVEKEVPADSVCPRLHKHGKSMKTNEVWKRRPCWRLVDCPWQRSSWRCNTNTSTCAWSKTNQLETLRDRRLQKRAHSIGPEPRRWTEGLVHMLTSINAFAAQIPWFWSFVWCICGNKTQNQATVDKAKFIGVGQAEFRRCVSFISQLPHVKPLIDDGSLELGPEFADIIFRRLKKVLVSVVWAEFFPSFFVEFFMKLEEPQTDEHGSTNGQQPQQQRLKLGQNVTIVAFMRINDDGPFDLREKYHLELADWSNHRVVFSEHRFIRSLYVDATFYNAVGTEFCLVFDVFYAKTGTEAVAESFYRVMNTQEQYGGQKLENLAIRSRVDWCLPAVLQCERPIKETLNWRDIKFQFLETNEQYKLVLACQTYCQRLLPNSHAFLFCCRLICIFMY